MLLDANLLIYAVDEGSPQHVAAREWLETTFNGDRRVALPWQTIGAFLRITTHPRIATAPLTGAEAWQFVVDWLDAPTTWIPPTSVATARVYGSLSSSVNITSNLVPDAQLAALAIEHGLEVMTADSDFARFPDVRWRNPLTP